MKICDRCEAKENVDTYNVGIIHPALVAKDCCKKIDICDTCRSLSDIKQAIEHLWYLCEGKITTHVLVNACTSPGSHAQQPSQVSADQLTSQGKLQPSQAQLVGSLESPDKLP